MNAAAHRDYRSNAAVQVYVFADRIEVRNPGELPPSLTPASLRVTHSSVPRNVRLAEVLWFAHYVEKVGTGTLDVIAGCQRADLPEPDFRQSGDEFVVTLWRDALTEEVLAGMTLNERQRVAIETVKRNGIITNVEYRGVTGTSDRTASRDLGELTAAGLLERVGTTGRATSYVIAMQTRHKPAKPATEAAEETRRKRAKPASAPASKRRVKGAKGSPPAKKRGRKKGPRRSR